jgi:hypothetical protein
MDQWWVSAAVSHDHREANSHDILPLLGFGRIFKIGSGGRSWAGIGPAGVGLPALRIDEETQQGRGT